MTKVRKSWTKEDVRKVARLWETSTRDELAKELGVNVEQVTYISSEMRKVGFNIPKKRRNAEFRLMLAEVLGEGK